MEDRSDCPFLPANYVTITDLKERWLKRQQERQKEKKQGNFCNDRHAQAQQDEEKLDRPVEAPAQSSNGEEKDEIASPKPNVRISFSGHRIYSGRWLERYRGREFKSDQPKKLYRQVELKNPGGDYRRVSNVYQCERLHRQVESSDRKPKEVLIAAVMIGKEGPESPYQKKLTESVHGASVMSVKGVGESQQAKAGEPKSNQKKKKQRDTGDSHLEVSKVYGSEGCWNVELSDPKPKGDVTEAFADGKEGTVNPHRKSESVKEELVAVAGGIRESHPDKIDLAELEKKGRKNKSRGLEADEDCKGETSKTTPGKEIQVKTVGVSDLCDQQAEICKALALDNEKVTARTADTRRRLVRGAVSIRRRDSEWPAAKKNDEWRSNGYHRGSQLWRKTAKQKVIWVRKEHSETAVA